MPTYELIAPRAYTTWRPRNRIPPLAAAFVLIKRWIERTRQRRALRPLNGAGVGLTRIGDRQSSRVERHLFRAALTSQPGHTTVSHDGQQPRPRIPFSIAVKVPYRAQHRVLNEILRVMLVAHQIARERVRIVEMRQDNSFEPIDVALGHC